jgi:hypothetical protein
MTIPRRSELECTEGAGPPAGARRGRKPGVSGTACVDVMEESVMAARVSPACSAFDQR